MPALPEPSHIVDGALCDIGMSELVRRVRGCRREPRGTPPPVDSLALHEIVQDEALPAAVARDVTPLLQSVRGTLHAQAAAIQDVCVNHRRSNVAVAEELLNRPDVGAGLEDVRGEGVPQRVTGRPLRDPCRGYRVAERSLNDTLVQMMTSADAALVHEGSSSREKVLPAPVELHVRIFSNQRGCEARGRDARAP